jgi:AGZA family xanthine/uracil permease-like MFS transporter
VTNLESDLNQSLITATAAIAGFSSFLFGFLTNMPVALAPGMGLNAYFAYQIVGFNGDGIISYNLALTAVFIEGLIFIFLSLIGMRQWLVKVIPVSLKIAAACGIGLFLALIGLSGSAGIGAVAGATATPLEVAGCPEQYLVEGICTSHKMTSPTVSKSIPLATGKC